MTRKAIIWMVGVALAAASIALVGCVAATSTVTPPLVKQHQAIPPGTACDAAGCHDTYKHQQPYLGPCDLCHNTTDWTQVTYTHKDPNFNEGMHPTLGCSFCHTEGQPLPNGQCSTCHDAPHAGWTACSMCHTPIAFGLRKPPPANHVSLLGGHSNLTCLQCHTLPQEPATPRTCVNCHPIVHTIPVRTCQDCHDPALGFKKPKKNFPHNEFFVLSGFHTTLKCAQCHKNASKGKFSGTPNVCVGCHGAHHGGLTDCAACHTTSSFIPSTFDHASKFPLTGRHASLACTKCHPNSEFVRTISSNGGTACVDCHGPHHGGLTNCAECHTTAGFEPSTFRHSTVFRLVGVHAHLACTECHTIKNVFTHVKGNGSHQCVACHGTHHGNQTACLNCHSSAEKSFVPLKSGVGHDGQSIPLSGFHAYPANQCGLCHGTSSNPNFAVTRTPCADCHHSGGSGTPPPHGDLGDCLDCHYPTTFSQAVPFTHPDIAGSPHNWTDFGSYPDGCVGCHPGLQFASHSCSTCHLAP